MTEKNGVSYTGARIAIQGFRGSFHERAAYTFFGNDIEIVPCETFRDLFASFKNGKADYAVCAIENSLAGSILPNYALLGDTHVEIFGEVYLHIAMQLMALQGQTLTEITEVHSHPVALLQCQNFFAKHQTMHQVESVDTALSAKEIAEGKILNRATVASTDAAEYYDLEILAENIHDNEKNFTRFLALRPRTETISQETATKASLSFRAHHTPGSLAKVLNIIGEHEINLSKIQSIPVVGEAWKYYMYVDLEFADYSSYKKALLEIEPYVTELYILGEYPQGVK
jgi:prephenate dehydratase